MRNYMTVEAAREKIDRLASYVHLVESFEAVSLEDHVVEQYARLGSLQKVADKINDMNLAFVDAPIEVDDVREVLSSRGSSELHKLMRSFYLKRTRSNRRRSKRY